LIVVDEEHDESYKQEEKTPYHGRDMALVKGQMTGAAVILGSATPAIQTYYRAYTGRHTLLSLPRRVEDRPLPPIELVDMRQDPTEDEILSRALRQAIAETLAQGKQVMLFLNRRGFSPYLSVEHVVVVLPVPIVNWRSRFTVIPSDFSVIIVIIPVDPRSVAPTVGNHG